MSYRPPHLRNQATASPSIPGAFQTYTRQDLASHYGCQVTDLHTLNASAHEPDDLSHVLIHRGQHPEYPTLFVHNNLHVLPPVSSDGSPLEGHQAQHPVPVFEEVPWGGGRFEFKCWVQIVRIKHLTPHSTELRDMLGRKFMNKVRNEDAWRQSLDISWAEVTTEKLDPQGEAPSIPHIVVQEDT